MEYKCPYCGQDSYSKTSKKQGKFTDWESVRRHTSSCIKNNNTYSITIEYGPIHYSELLNTEYKVLKYKYPNVKLSSLVKKFKDASIIDKNFTIKPVIPKVELINQINKFVSEHGHIPSSRDFNFYTKNTEFCTTTFQKYFGSWNAAIEEAGYTPNIQNGYGVDTKALDGHMYRSRAEAYFANTYLYNKYEYIIEPKYLKPFQYWNYDWYIKELNLYIELDGEIRPERIKQKKLLNKQLNINCAFIYTKDIYGRKNLLEML
jgi:hypothetical protein